MLDQGRTRSASRTDAREAAARPPSARQRERGLWSFLTWSFFISHVVAAQQAAAAGAMAAEAPSDGLNTAEQRAEVPFSAAALEQPGFDPAEIQHAAGPQVQQVEPAAPTFLALEDQAPAPSDAGALEHSAFDDAVHATPRGQTAVADVVGKSSPAEAAAPPVATELGQVLEQVLDPVTHVVGGVLDGVVDPLLTPLTGLVGDVVEDLTPVLDQVLDPVTGAVSSVVHVVTDLVDPLLTPVGGLAGDVVEALVPAIDQVISPVADLTGSVIELTEPVLDPVIAPTAAVLEELLQTLDPVIDPVTGIAAGAGALLGEAIEPATALVGDAVEPLVPVVNDLTAPIGEVVGPLLAPIGSVLGPVTAPLLGPVADGISLLEPLTGQVSDSAGVSAEQPLSALLGLDSGGESILIGPVAAAAGSLDLPELPVLGAIDELFSGGSYTEYSLALQGSAGAGSQPLAAGAGALDGLVTGIENIALFGQDSADAGSDAPAAILPNILGGGGLRLDWAGL